MRVLRERMSVTKDIAPVMEPQYLEREHSEINSGELTAIEL